MAEAPPPGGTVRDPRRLLVGAVIAAVVLTLALIVTGLVWAHRVMSAPTAPDTGPLAVPAAPAPGAEGSYCSELLRQLPQQLIDEPRREVIGRPPGVAAWGDPAIILRCGLPDPAELSCASPLTQFSSPDGTAVAWLRLSDPSATTYLAVDRPVRVGVTLPPGTGVAPIQQLTEVVGQALPERPVCSSGTVTPPDNG